MSSAINQYQLVYNKNSDDCESYKTVKDLDSPLNLPHSSILTRPTRPVINKKEYKLANHSITANTNTTITMQL